VRLKSNSTSGDSRYWIGNNGPITLFKGRIVRSRHFVYTVFPHLLLPDRLFCEREPRRIDSTPGLVASESSILQEPKNNRWLEFVQTKVEFRTESSLHLPHLLPRYHNCSERYYALVDVVPPRTSPRSVARGMFQASAEPSTASHR
jgi:hypothetical protein